MEHCKGGIFQKSNFLTDFNHILIFPPISANQIWLKLKFLPIRNCWKSIVLDLNLPFQANWCLVCENSSVEVDFWKTITFTNLLISIPYTLVVDLMVYDATFDGMKLAGIIIICCGFLVVLFPENWPDLLQSLIR